MRDKTYTQVDTIKSLRQLGVSDVGIRTLQFWRQEGLIPQLRREGNTYFYVRDDVEKIIDVCARRPSDEKVMQIVLEDVVFEITRIEVVRIAGSLKILYHMRDGSKLVRELKEDILDALSTEG